MKKHVSKKSVPARRKASPKPLPAQAAIPFAAPAKKAPYRFAQGRCVYEASWQGTPYEIWPTPATQNIEYKIVNHGLDVSRPGPWTFNYAVRREPLMLVSGDLPRLALAQALPQADLNPNFLRLGDLRVRVTVGGESFWLDERGSVTTRYYPWGTTHRVDLRPLDLAIEMTAVLAGTAGAAVQIEATGTVGVDLELFFGGIDQEGTLYWPEYLRAHEDAYPWHFERPIKAQDEVSLQAGVAQFFNPQVAARMSAAAEPAYSCRVVEHEEWKGLNRVPHQDEYRARRPGAERRQRRAAFACRLDPAGGPAKVRMLAWKNEPGMSALEFTQFDEYVQEARAYYENMLAPFEMQTPDAILDAAFDAAVVNMDYVHNGQAWFEGIHEWNAYWVTNYQISAAIAIGQLKQAGEALRFFADAPEGPGVPVVGDRTSANYRAVAGLPCFEGLPYYVVQLHRYWLASGDMATLKHVFEPTLANLERMLKHHDPDGDTLLNWPVGCNLFLYQSDRLSLPGAGASPSIMASGMMDMMADLADVVGQPQPAQGLRTRAAHMRAAIVKKLWLEGEGRFASGVDPLGHVHKSAYYTDYVFPILYSRLGDEYTMPSLEALDRDLWLGDTLLRTGNYMPNYFGNNAVHNVAMAESAEAYCRAGRADRGWALLHGVARAATVLTDSPGAISEYLSLTGFGVADWIFGNPIGAFIQAAVSGLFGFDRTAPGQQAVWHPCIPEAWPQAHLRMHDVVLTVTGTADDRKFEIALPTAQAMQMRLPRHGRTVVSACDAQGRTLPAQDDGDFVVISLPSALLHTVQLRLGKAARRPAPRRKLPAARKRPLPAIAGRRQAIALDNLFNAEGIDGFNFGNFWRYDFAGTLDKQGKFRIGKTQFGVAPTGRNMVRLELGRFNIASSAMVPADVPDRIAIPVGRAVKGLEFLVSSDARCRLTNMEIGRVILKYHNGTTGTEPLVFGWNIDSSFLPFVDAMTKREMPHDPAVTIPFTAALLTIPTQSSKVLDEVVIEIQSSDAALGILGMNLIR